MSIKFETQDRRGFPLKLSLARTFRCFTQEELANFIGIPYNTYRAYEYGRTSPSIETLRKIAITLDVSVDWLLELSYSIEPKESRERCIGTDGWKIVESKLFELSERLGSKEWTDKMAKESGFDTSMVHRRIGAQHVQRNRQREKKRDKKRKNS